MIGTGRGTLESRSDGTLLFIYDGIPSQEGCIYDEITGDKECAMLAASIGEFGFA